MNMFQCNINLENYVQAFHLKEQLSLTFQNSIQKYIQNLLTSITYVNKNAFQ